MQEYGWYHWNDLREMAWEVEKRKDPRKMRLAACAFLRRAWPLIEDSRLRAAVEVAEDHADFRVNRQRLKAARASLVAIRDEARLQVLNDRGAVPDWADADPDYAEWRVLRSVDSLPAVCKMRLVQLVLQTGSLDFSYLRGVSAEVVGLVGELHPDNASEELIAHCDLLRDIFGNPFRPVTFPPEWRTDTAVSLARTMYDSREFGAMPILADALQDAGCDSDDILSHCRDGNQLHVRGCWVIDLVLGKS